MFITVNAVKDIRGIVMNPNQAKNLVVQGTFKLQGARFSEIT